MTIRVNNTITEPGCYVEGHWGQYGLRRFIEIADGILGTTLALQLPNEDHDDYLDHAIDIADEAEQLLNDATEGGGWVWQDGEVFLVTNEDLAEMMA
jgi:hypothetical protein